jgi:hypothetical protein
MSAPPRSVDVTRSPRCRTMTAICAFETFEATSPNRREAVMQTKKGRNGIEGVWLVLPLKAGLPRPAQLLTITKSRRGAPALR